MAAFLVILGLVVVVAFYVIAVYNRFVGLRNQTRVSLGTSAKYHFSRASIPSRKAGLLP